MKQPTTTIPTTPEARKHRIDTFRAKHNLTHTQAAQLCLTPLSTWEQWASGNTKPPNALWVLFNILDEIL